MIYDARKVPGLSAEMHEERRDVMKPEGWDVAFDDPVPLPGGGELATLREAGDHIARLPQRQQTRPEWQRAAKYLLLAATADRAWRWFARRAVYVAIHGDRPETRPERPSKAERWRALRKAARSRK